MTIKVLLSNDEAIGTIESLSFHESPNDHGQKLTIEKMSLDTAKLSEIFSRAYVHPMSQKYPFQILIENETKIYVHNVWLEDVEKTYKSTDSTILENVKSVAESISGTIK